MTRCPPCKRFNLCVAMSFRIMEAGKVYVERREDDDFSATGARREDVTLHH